MTDPKTGEPLDNLTPKALSHITQLGSQCTRASEIVQQKDEPVYGRIRSGITAVNNQVYDVEVCDYALDSFCVGCYSSHLI